MSSLTESFIRTVDAPLTLFHPVAVSSLVLSGLGLLAAAFVYWLRHRVILPELQILRTENRYIQQELTQVREELAFIKAQVTAGLNLLTDLHQRARLLSLLRIILSIALLLGRTGALALVFRFLGRRIWWQALAKEGIEELAARLQDALNTPRSRRSGS